MRYIISFFIYLYDLKPYKINGGNILNLCYLKTSSDSTYFYTREAYAVMQKKKKLPDDGYINHDLYKDIK